TPVDGCRVVAFVTHGDDALSLGSWACAALASINQDYENTTTQGSDGTTAAASGLKTTAGATGNITWTSNVTEEHAAFVVALRPLISSVELEATAAGASTVAGAVTVVNRPVG